jgi:polysaccharide pyruvyl transferase WcaK-like protein
MRILIMGTPVASGNRGVLALGAAITDLCLEASPDADVRYLQVHKPTDDALVRTRRGVRRIPIVTCRMSPRAALRDQLAWIVFLSILYRVIPPLRDVIRRHSPWIEAVAAADWVGDVRGGDSFSDIYGLKRFVLAFLPVLSVVLIKGSIVHLPQTYGPFRTRAARWLARLVLRRSSLVVARDTESQRIAQELVGGLLQVGLSPDVAFALHSEPPADLPPPAPRTVGLNINGLLFNGGYTGGNEFGLRLDYPEFPAAMIAALLEDPVVNVLLVPHTIAPAGDRESDNEACRVVHAALSPAQRERVHLLTGDYDAHQLKGIIRQCDFFIGSRMHSCIAALSQGVPCVGVAYSMKFAGVFESVGMGGWVIDGRKADCEEAVRMAMELYQNRDDTREPLARNAAAARRRLDEVFKEIVTTSCNRA